MKMMAQRLSLVASALAFAASVGASPAKDAKFAFDALHMYYDIHKGRQTAAQFRSHWESRSYDCERDGNELICFKGRLGGFAGRFNPTLNQAALYLSNPKECAGLRATALAKHGKPDHNLEGLLVWTRGGVLAAFMPRNGPVEGLQSLCSYGFGNR